MRKDMLPSDLTRVALSFYEGLEIPVASALANAVRSRDWKGVAAHPAPDPRCFTDPLSYYLQASAVGLLRKLEDLPADIDKASAARQKWWQGEEQCYLTNQRINRYLPENQLFADREPGISDFISEVRQLILRWIGSGPKPEPSGAFGPGATFSDRGDFTTVPDKMTSDPTLTPAACTYVAAWIDSMWGRAICATQDRELSYVPGNRFATAPKTALTDRAIAVEPSINVFFQLALGRELKSLMKRNAYWDMKKAQDTHRQVARVSSVDREFATLDLSNASDTVAKEVVRLLLPHRWFKALSNLRSPRTRIDDRWVMLEKFSSMGNGFTFELETIIFAALVSVAVRRQGGQGELGMDVYVYGDDIICPDGAVRGVKAVLEFFGFSLNAEKSFWGSVPFRESCGGDYFMGKTVRPFHLKSTPKGPEDWISFANGLRRILDSFSNLGWDCPRKSWFVCLDQIPSDIRRCRGPRGLGDIVIHDGSEFWKTRWMRGYRWIQVYRPHRYRLIRFEGFRPDVQLASLVYGAGVPFRGGVIPRNGVKSYKRGWIPCSQGLHE